MEGILCMNVIHYLKAHLHTLVIGVIFICLLIAQIMLTVSINNYLPEIISFKYRDGIRLDITNLEAVENTSGVSQSMGVVRSLYIEQPTMIIATNDEYARITKMDILFGSYFVSKDHPMKNRFVVISKELSLKLFKTYDSIGQIVELNNIKYTICAVYESDGSLLENMAKSTHEVVYVPLISDFQPEKLTSVITESNAEIVQSAADTISIGLESYFTYDNAVNFSSVRHIVSQSVRLTIFFCGIGVCIWLVIIGIKRFRLCHSLQERAKTSVYFAIPIVLIFLISFKLYIPFSWLPKDNIFDFAFYQEQLIKIFNDKNTFASVIDPFWNYAFIAIPLCFALGVAAIIVFYCGFITAIKRNKED